MSKIRVHELAKELDKPNKDIMQILSDNKIEVKSHMSTLTEDDVKLVKNYYHKQTTAGKEEPAGKMEEKKTLSLLTGKRNRKKKRPKKNEKISIHSWMCTICGEN